MISIASLGTSLLGNKKVLIGIAIALVFVYIGYLSMRLDNEKAKREVAEVSLAVAEEREKLLQEGLKRSEERTAEYNESVGKAREEKNAKKTVYSRHNLSELAAKKSGLVTRKMRRATTDVWMSFDKAGAGGGTTDLSESTGS